MDQQTIFITGAASGIGQTTARLFHHKGWFVGCCDIDEQALAQLSAELGDNCLTLCADVSIKQEIDDAMSAFAEQTEQRLDIMFNNAGIAIGGHFDDLPYEQIMKMVNVNFPDEYFL